MERVKQSWRYTSDDKARMVTLYRQGKSMAEVGAVFGCSLQAVCRHLKTANEPRRPPSARRWAGPPPNPGGLCECGCGERTAIARKSNPRQGIVKGEPNRYFGKHKKRGMENPQWLGRECGRAGYRIKPIIHVDGRSKHVAVHTIVAERALGRPLPRGANVHHVNENRADNRPGNLVICQNAAYHTLLHWRLRALRATGHPDWRKCSMCGQWDAPANLRLRGTRRSSSVHRACEASLATFRNRWRGPTEGVNMAAEWRAARLNGSSAVDVERLSADRVRTVEVATNG